MWILLLSHFRRIHCKIGHQQRCQYCATTSRACDPSEPDGLAPHFPHLILKSWANSYLFPLWTHYLWTQIVILMTKIYIQKKHQPWFDSWGEKMRPINEVMEERGLLNRDLTYHDDYIHLSKEKKTNLPSQAVCSSHQIFKGLSSLARIKCEKKKGKFAEEFNYYALFHQYTTTALCCISNAIDLINSCFQ